MEPSELIANVYKSRVNRNPRYSLRAFAKSINIPSGRLSEILNGKRNLTFASAEKIAPRLFSTEQERKEFLFAVVEEKISDKKLNQKNDQYKTTKNLDEDELRLTTSWVYPAIMSLFETLPEKKIHSSSLVANRLGISEDEAAKFLDNMLRLNIISTDENGAYRVCYEATTTSDGIPSKALREIHKNFMEEAISSLNEVDPSLRDMSSMTMAIDMERLPEAVKLIRNFRRELCKFMESGNQQEVYQLNIQLFPLSKVSKNEEEKLQ